ncbi:MULTISPECIES: hypothetical protein [unclassified Tolypothrix]|uniref:hypothetical protein n=1 Tax=unclassified Tolypothrix TaxID=2649714 RepID=UPI000B5EC71C|nr:MULTISPECIES: hypothetical protein [unclassified Tolypothrix]UYD26508.1 hypothetical protein HGR01_35395 [Tolypothrix sp. PCC 7712]UYD31254.1 hypothetical protein HG267_19085 [Tolypothrix sp. PCC 7601]BAY92555.1 hypothetical protein NIES3275_45910 [Microchaete diplosiphon NIES-3275]
MGNGEWGTGNGEWGMGNGQWGTGNGQWGMGNGQWGMQLLYEFTKIRQQMLSSQSFGKSSFLNYELRSALRFP